MLGKAWYIVGYTHDGGAYCPAHAPSDAERSPVFATDEQDFTCEVCGQELK